MAGEVLILKDSNGAYYQLDRAVLVAARLPDDRVHEIEAVLAGEVSGYGVTPGSGLHLDVLGAMARGSSGFVQPPPPPHGDMHGDHADSHFDYHP